MGQARVLIMCLGPPTPPNCRGRGGFVTSRWLNVTLRSVTLNEEQQ